MTELQDWAVGMCTVGIGCALLYMLCPVGVMRRVFGVLTAVFFLCCLLTPIRNVIGMASELFALPDDTEVPTALAEEVEEQAEMLIADALLRDATQRLGRTVTIRKVTVCRDNTRTDSIYIERVRVTLDREDKEVASTVRATLEQAWGTVVEVYYVG